MHSAESKCRQTLNFHASVWGWIPDAMHSHGELGVSLKTALDDTSQHGSVHNAHRPTGLLPNPND